jgi:hypothetical protein
MMYPLVLDLAADNVPVTVTCRVLGFSKQAFYAWRKCPVTQRDWDDAQLINAAVDAHEEAPTFGYRLIADELADLGFEASERRVWAAVFRERHRFCDREAARKGKVRPARAAGPRRPRQARVHRRRAEPVVVDRHHGTLDR